MSEEFDNPFSDESQSHQSETPIFEQVLTNAIEARLLEVHTSLPCVITNVRSNSIVDIQPLLQRKYRDGSLVKLPIIQNCPVSHPRGNDYWIKLPLSVNDKGTALFAERSLDNWLASGDFVDPNDHRLHHLTDAIFIPGLYPQNSVVAGDASDLVVNNGKSEIQFKKSGRFKIKNDTNELLDVLDQITAQLSALAQSLSVDTTNTVFGPMKLNNFSTYATIEGELDSLKAKLETLKG